MSADKDPITCHVLDTTAGRPAKGIRVRLEGPSSPSSSPFSTTTTTTASSSNAAAAAAQQPKVFESVTDNDGRIRLWLPYSSANDSDDVSVHPMRDVLGAVRGASHWTLRFDTAHYFGAEGTFFPEATVVFRVEEGQTYHVPLLLSPYSYTTYRGS